MKSNEMDELAVEPEDSTQLGVAESEGSGSDGLEHGLDVDWRARHHAEDLAGGGLLLERVAEGALRLFICHCGLTDLVDSPEGRATLQAELGVRRIVLLAPRTLHAGNPPSELKPGTVGQVARA
jgi:hypothetical protein